jgi:hypothetical protein
MAVLLGSLETTRTSWSSAPQPKTYPEAMASLGGFADYKRTSKRSFVKERRELGALYSNIQTKLRTYSLRAWEPKEGLRLAVSWLSLDRLTDRTSISTGSQCYEPRR